METQNKPYTFISYAHANRDIVLPAIREMQAQGICVWYDNGIEAGSEWPEFIAEKVVNCSEFVLFISKAYLESQNCKRELNFAISRKKRILSVFLEDVELSPGMEMQLGTYQAVFRQRFFSQHEFYVSLAKEPFFSTCRESAAAARADPCPAQTATPVAHSDNTNTDHNPAVSFFNSQLPLKSKQIAGVLALFLGGLGIHKFYLGQFFQGIIRLIFCWTYIPTILGTIEGIIILCQSDDTFTTKYNCRLK